jgi:hypothetical protein
METVMCEQCGEAPGTYPLNHAIYCDSCGEEALSEELKDILGYKPCATIVWPKEGQPALCLVVYGLEHDHS